MLEVEEVDRGQRGFGGLQGASEEPSAFQNRGCISLCGGIGVLQRTDTHFRDMRDFNEALL